MMFFSCGLSSSVNKFFYNSKSKKQHNKDLFEACVKDDTTRVRALLALGTSTDFNVSYYWASRNERMPAKEWGDEIPLMHLAAMVPFHPEILKILIESQPNLTAPYEPKGGVLVNSRPGSILHNAASIHTKVGIFEILINAGADVNATNSKGISVVSALLTTNPHIKTDENNKNKLKILKLLIDKGAKLSDSDVTNMFGLIGSKGIVKDDITSLLSLFWNNKVKFTDPAKTEIDVNIRDDKGRTPVYLIAQNFEALDLVLDKEDVNIADNQGVTPLHQAAQSSAQCVEKLLKYNANINAIDNDAKTAVHYAAANPEALEVLLKRGAKCDERDKEGKTPLVLALKANCLASVRALIKNGAFVWTKDNNGNHLEDIVTDFNSPAWAYIREARCTQQHENSAKSEQRLVMS